MAVVAMFNLQASIDRLNEIVAEAFKPAEQDPKMIEVERLAQAIKLLQRQDAGLSNKDKITMVELFRENIVAVDTYLAHSDDTLRQAWLKDMLSSRQKVYYSFQCLLNHIFVRGFTLCTVCDDDKMFTSRFGLRSMTTRAASRSHSARILSPRWAS